MSRKRYLPKQIVGKLHYSEVTKAGCHAIEENCGLLL